MAAEKKTILIDLNFDASNIIKGVSQAKKGVDELNSSFGKTKKGYSDYSKEVEKENAKSETALEKKKKKEAEAAAAKEKQDAEIIARAKKLEEAIQQVGDTVANSIGATPRANELITQIEDIRKNIALLNQTNKTLKDGLKEVEVGSAAYTKINSALVVNEAQLKELNGEYSNLSKELQNNVKESKAQEGSYEQLYRRYVQADIALKNLGGTMKVNKDGTVVLTDEYKKAKKEVENLKNGILKFGEGIKDGRLNVGNYASSIGDAFQKTGLFGEALNKLTSIFEATKGGLNIVQEGATKVKDGLTAAKGAFETFTSSFSTSTGSSFSIINPDEIDAGTEALGNLGEKSKDTSKDISYIGAEGLESGKKITVGTNIGANGMKVLKVAIASTGIGLLVIIIASLIQYFTKFQKGIDLVSKATAVVGAVIDSIVGTVVKLGTALANLDFDSFANAFTGAADKAKAAAKETARLADEKVRLEEQDIRNIAIQDELADAAERARLLAADKTKTEQERIDLIEFANKQEKALLENQLKAGKDKLQLLNDEIALEAAAGNVSRERLKEQAELTKQVGDIEDDINNKTIQALAETSKLRNKLNSERIRNEQSLLNNELTIAELSGAKNFELRRTLARKERDAKIQEAEGDAEAIKVIESDFQTSLAVIRKEQNEQTLSTLKQVQQERISFIVDEKQREIAAEAFALKEKLDAIKGNGKAEVELREALATSSANRIREIENKFAEQSYQERLDKQNNFVTLANQSNDKIANERLLALKQSQQDELTLLIQRNASSAEIEDVRNKQQREFANESLLIEQDRLQKILAIQLSTAGARALSDEEFYQKELDLLNKQLEEKKITEELYIQNKAQLDKENIDRKIATEQESNASILQATQDVNNVKLEIQATANQNLIADAEQTSARLKAIDELRIQNALGVVNAFKDILSTDTKNRKQYKDAVKALSIAEIGINLYKEIAGYWTGVGQDAGKTGIITGAGLASSIVAGVLTAGAIARALSNTQKVLKYEEGGYTLDKAIKQYNPIYSSNFTGGMISKPTLWTNTTMNLGGEKGKEYVAPNWQINQDPNLFNSLERWRVTGVKPFADGGFTSMTVTNPVVNNLEAISVAIVKGFANAPTPIVSVQEINSIQARVETIESRASLQ